jgi:SOS response regulatory protein OraA/RecX
LIKQSLRDEFESQGVATVREQVKAGRYPEEKCEQAIEWLNQRDAQNQAELARSSARQTRLLLISILIVSILNLIVSITLF